jgi:ABC-type sulfate transport system permease component
VKTIFLTIVSVYFSLWVIKYLLALVMLPFAVKVLCTKRNVIKYYWVMLFASSIRLAIHLVFALPFVLIRERFGFFRLRTENEITEVIYGK